MSGLVQIDYMTPAVEVERTREAAYDKFGEYDGAVGRYVDDAIREVRGLDEDVDTTHDTLTTIAEEAGVVVSDGDQKKNRMTSSIPNQETTRFQPRVTEEAKDALREAAEGSDNNTGVVLGRILYEYRDGGRTGKNRRVAERLRENQVALDTLTGGDDTGSEERKLQGIESEIGESFTDEELETAIAEYAGDSHGTIKRWTKKVLDDLPVEPHPERPDEYIPHWEADDLTPDGLPFICRVPVPMLDKDQTVHRVRLEAATEAAAPNRGLSKGKAKIDAEAICDHILDGEYSPGSDEFDALLQRVADGEGYHIGVSQGKTVLIVNVKEATAANTIRDEQLKNYMASDAVPKLAAATDPLAASTGGGTGQSAAADGGDFS